MDLTVILAQAAETVSTAEEQRQIVPIDWIYEQITTLSWLQAVIAISFGVVYLLYGWRIFKALAVISFALLGIYAGLWAGKQFGNELWGGVIGAGVLAIVSVPLMRWAVSALGAVAGAVIAGGIWYGCGLPEQYIWAGAISGVIAGGMISFIVFKIAVMLFTSLAGGAITMTGVLSLIYHYEQTAIEPTNQINELLHTNTWFLPLALIIPTVFGIIVQNRLVKDAPKWEL